jgi:hypothetical protein
MERDWQRLTRQGFKVELSHPPRRPKVMSSSEPKTSAAIGSVCT